MLLIIILGLIAKLMSVSGDCDTGTQLVNNLDWNKISGPRAWYVMLHTSNDLENNLDCVEPTILSPEGNTSLTTVNLYDISKQRHMTIYGNATNWNSSGYFDAYHPLAIWSGRFYVIAIDYDRYFIIKICPFNSKEGSVHVGYRSRHPDETTVNDVLMELAKNNIDVSQLVEWGGDHCQRA